MFEVLSAAVEELEVPPCRPAILEVLAVIDTLQAKVTTAVGQFDAEGMWALDGATSMTAWLRHSARLSGATASSVTRTGRRLRSLPVTSSSWLGGTLSGGQVQAIVANLDDETAPLFAEHEAVVVPALEELSVKETASAMLAWKARAEALGDKAEPAPPPRSLHLSQTLDGTWRLDGTLGPLDGTIVETALRLATTEDAEGESRTPSEKRADALVDVFRFFLDHQQSQKAGRHRPHVNVVVKYEDLVGAGPGELVDGGWLGGPTLAALVCDSALHRLVMSGPSSILDYGTATRTVPVNLWNALVLRDRHCRHPGCDRPAKWCEGHHVIPVSLDGPTELANLVLKCSRHHHLAHQPGWSEKLKPDGTYELTAPDGRTWTTTPRGL